MASNTEFTHRRSSSAVSSVDEVTSNDGTLSGPASIVPTARSTPFIGPQNHPGIPAQHHPAVPALSLGNNGGFGHHQLHDTAFASQMAGIESQMRLLNSIGSGYGVNFHEPTVPDGIDINELRAIEADSMFAEYYHHFDPADGPFPASNSAQAIAASSFNDTNNNIQWGPRQFCHVPDDESDNEENNEDIMAAYDRPLIPRYPGSPSYTDLVSASFAMPARPGTIAGMAIRDPTQPAQAPLIMHFEPRFPADTIPEMTGPAHESATPASPVSAPGNFESSLTAAVHTIQARPISTSSIARSQEFEASSSPTDTDAFVQSPVFPVNWVTHTRTSMLPSLPPSATSTTPNRRHSRRHTINYTISPPSNGYIEEDEGDDA
ncbi:hypothetical protein E4T44_02331 [Aureobasidium sp. EXF-8845]|nr:hypothetical protein E4T44_02331 [Aureobasidium sp. EXF-8845]KAI4856481.1 hypothetical protein E4T45_02055 [Aureobasidium sp. EXF-8846]